MRYTKRDILLLSFLLEGALIVSYFVWAYFRNVSISLEVSFDNLILGVVFSLPLFLINFILFSSYLLKHKRLEVFYDFKDKIVKPLADELDYKTAFLVAILAGLGEELFFRGILQWELGIYLSSILFSLLHFGQSAWKYLPIAILYGLIGLYFSYVLILSGTLFVPIVTHAFYDYLALLYMKYYFKSK